MITSLIIRKIDWAGGLWYTAIMILIVRIPDALAKRLAAVGASPERVALDALQHAADDLERGQRAAAGAIVERTPTEAAARMRRSRPSNVLPEGITIRDLMSYGRA
jgi:hypothetical protein